MLATTFRAALLIILVNVLLAPAVLGGGSKKNNQVVGPEQMDEFDARVQALLEAGYDFRVPAVPHLQDKVDTVISVITLDTVGTSTYDLGWNQIPDKQVALATGGAFDGIHLTYMKMTTPATSTRFATYSFYSRLIGDFLGEFVPATHAGSGWPRVADGPGHEGMYVYHFSSGALATHFRKDDGEGFLTFGSDAVVDPAGLWPGISSNGNRVVVTSTDDPSRNPGRTYVSTDGGATFTEIGWPALAIPGTVEFANAETTPWLNPANPQQVSVLNIEDDDATPNAAGMGGLSWSTSISLNPGTGWDTEIVYQFRTMLPDNSYYDPFGLAAEVFHQTGGAIGDDGIGHVVFNGSGIQFDANGDTLYSIHPLVYWNSSERQLIELTDPAIARNPLLADSIDARFPGRSWGMGYPSVTTGPNGTVLAAWEQPELVNPNELRYVFGLVSGIPGPKFFATDIYAAFSPDNGHSWSAPFKLGGLEGEMDLFPQLGRLEMVGNDVHVHFMYFWDSNPGQALVANESDVTAGAWIYEEVVIAPQVVGIGGEDGLAPVDFRLRQNFPNPFNPGTRIGFTLNKTARVILEVFNLRGQKVATLVNGQQAAGEHEVSFDGSGLASGIYLYKLKAGSFQQTRKMVLMR